MSAEKLAAAHSPASPARGVPPMAEGEFPRCTSTSTVTLPNGSFDVRCDLPQGHEGPHRSLDDGDERGEHEITWTVVPE